jgi:hypothetical protein
MTVKEGHIAVTMTAPARGRACTPLFTFSGQSNTKDMARLCGNKARWNKTPNGWPTYESTMVWGHMMVAHKRDLKLDKMLIFCDNADIHMNSELALLFVSNDIRLFGLIPSSTHATQPLDLNFFGLIKPKLDVFARQKNVLLKAENVVFHWLEAVKALEHSCQQRGDSLLTSGFKAAGICPFDPSKSIAKTAYAEAVYKPTAAEVEAARVAGKAAGKLQKAEIIKCIEDSLAGRVTGAAMLFKPLSEAGIEERKKLAGVKKAPEQPADAGARAVFFLQRHSYTSETFAQGVLDKQKAEADAAAAKAVKKALDASVRAAKDAAEQAAKNERKRMKEEKRKAAAAVAEAKAQRKAAKEAGEGQKGGGMGLQGAVKGVDPKKKVEKRVKRTRQEEVPAEFGPPKRKRAMKP